jgi:heme/copper-type cytochrome/quinol oxidase subunit 1
MDWYARWFIKASLAWLGVGVTLGVVMAVWPRLIYYRPAHMHANLLGFVAMMIFGVGYHVLPRFSGHRLHSRILPAIHWWAANVGLAAMITGFMLLPHGVGGARMVLAAGGTISAAGAYLFIYNLWRTMKPPPPWPVGRADVQKPARRTGEGTAAAAP